MNNKSRKKNGRLSIFISLILRHKPETVGLELDNEGYLNINELINGINETGKFTIDRKLLMTIVRQDNKQRYDISSDGTKIRANQGHSIDVDLGFTKANPECALYHGTADRFAESIERNGIHRANRQYVHLTDKFDSAVSVGKRHGTPVVYQVNVEQMVQDGHSFWLSKNNVWLTKFIPARYISKCEEEPSSGK